MGDLIIQATIVQTTNTGYDEANLVPIQTTKTFTVDGFFDSWTLDELKDSSVRTDDIKFYVFPNNVQYVQNDPVTLKGTTYKLQRASPVMVGNQIALTLFQLRK